MLFVSFLIFIRNWTFRHAKLKTAASQLLRNISVAAFFAEWASRPFPDIYSWFLVCRHTRTLHRYPCMAELAGLSIHSEARRSRRTGIPDRPCTHTWNRYCSVRICLRRTSSEAPASCRPALW